MPTFTYTARNASGQMVKGRLEADDRKQAVRQLGGQKLRPVSMAEKAEKTRSVGSPQGQSESLLQRSIDQSDPAAPASVAGRCCPCSGPCPTCFPAASRWATRSACWPGV